jgi:hypothetical protein
LFSITVKLLRCPPNAVDRFYDGLESVEVGGGLCGVVSDLSMAYPPANQFERWALGEPLCPPYTRLSDRIISSKLGKIMLYESIQHHITVYVKVK